MSSLTVFRHRLTGAIFVLCAGVLALVWLGQGFWLPELAELYSVIRMLDSLALHLLALTLLGVPLLVMLGARWMASLVVLGVVALGGMTLQPVIQASQYPATALRTDLNLIWFNVLGDNQTPPEVIAEALIGADADVVILAEARQFRDLPDGVAEAFPYRLGCLEGATCSTLVLSRLPLGDPEITRLSTIYPERFTRAGITVEGHAPFTLVSAHMVKPWFGGQAVDEESTLIHRLRRLTEGPMVLVGDFNATPWSRRLQTVMRQTNLRAVFPSPATWPEQLGRFGLPIDNVLTKGGVTVTRVEGWGADLGSNHLGLRIGLSLPPA